MAWGAKQTATQLTAITVEQFFDKTPQLAIGEDCRVQIKIDFPVSPTDYALISVYTTLDDTTEEWDVVPVFAFEVDFQNDPSVVAFTIPYDVYRFRIGVQRSGTTDTIVSADMGFRLATP